MFTNTTSIYSSINIYIFLLPLTSQFLLINEGVVLPFQAVDASE